MSCENCDITLSKPGKTIKVTKDLKHCAVCGEAIYDVANMHSRRKEIEWNNYFLTICKAIASKSPCLSRQIGAILVRDKSIVSTGFNGPARGFPHCSTKGNVCPRKALGYASGEGLIHCPAAHAEANCIANAARIGASTVGTTLYMNCIIPCKDCMIILVNAGIVEVVVEELTPYHQVSLEIAKHGNIKLRSFKL